MPFTDIRARRGRSIFVCSLLALACSGSVFAQGIRADRPGAFLVFPEVRTSTDGVILAETYLSITNIASAPKSVHVAFISGDTCSPCELDLDLGPRDTETLVFFDNGDETTFVRNQDSGVNVLCPRGSGFATAHVQDATGVTLYEDVLIGDTIVADIQDSTTRATPAVAIQAGALGGDGSRRFSFDGPALRLLPQFLYSDLFAPDPAGSGRALFAELTLLTLDFDAFGKRPFTTCSVTGRDATGSGFSTSLSFGCWTRVDLVGLSSEFARPDFGEHGSIRLSCGSDPESDGELNTTGGVLGTLTQELFDSAELVFQGNPIDGDAAFSRLLQPSRTTGEPIVFSLVAPPGGPAEGGTEPQHEKGTGSRPIRFAPREGNE